MQLARDLQHRPLDTLGRRRIDLHQRHQVAVVRVGPTHVRGRPRRVGPTDLLPHLFAQILAKDLAQHGDPPRPLNILERIIGLPVQRQQAAINLGRYRQRMAPRFHEAQRRDRRRLPSRRCQIPEVAGHQCHQFIHRHVPHNGELQSGATPLPVDPRLHLGGGTRIERCQTRQANPHIPARQPTRHLQPEHPVRGPLHALVRLGITFARQSQRLRPIGRVRQIGLQQLQRHLQILRDSGAAESHVILLHVETDVHRPPGQQRLDLLAAVLPQTTVDHDHTGQLLESLLVQRHGTGARAKAQLDPNLVLLEVSLSHIEAQPVGEIDLIDAQLLEVSPRGHLARHRRWCAVGEFDGLALLGCGDRGHGALGVDLLDHARLGRRVARHHQQSMIGLPGLLEGRQNRGLVELGDGGLE